MMCRLTKQHAASFVTRTEAGTGADSTGLIQDEFDAFLESDIPPDEFLRLRCADCGPKQTTVTAGVGIVSGIADLQVAEVRELGIDALRCWRRPKTEPLLRVVPAEN